jgi:hypothetical protein
VLSNAEASHLSETQEHADILPVACALPLQGGVEVLSDGVGLTVTSQTVPGGAAAAGDGQSSGARVQYATSITTRLLLDCMGHASPVVRQLRWVGHDLQLAGCRYNMMNCIG